MTTALQFLPCSGLLAFILVLPPISSSGSGLCCFDVVIYCY